MTSPKLTNTTKSRRDFFKTSGSVLSASWLAVNAPLILAACTTANTKSTQQADYENITPHEARELAAIVDQIIPPDETPGATQTGVVYFIDVAVGGFMADVTLDLRQGLKDLQQKAKSVGAKGGRFSDLSFEQQTVVLKEVEDTQFFGTLHFLTMIGMFCLPQYGGNRENIGWDLLGFDHRHVWQPPFGYYDAAVSGQTPGAGEKHGRS